MSFEVFWIRKTSISRIHHVICQTEFRSVVVDISVFQYDAPESRTHFLGFLISFPFSQPAKKEIAPLDKPKLGQPDGAVPLKAALKANPIFNDLLAKTDRFSTFWCGIHWIFVFFLSVVIIFWSIHLNFQFFLGKMREISLFLQLLFLITLSANEVHDHSASYLITLSLINLSICPAETRPETAWHPIRIHHEL